MARLPRLVIPGQLHHVMQFAIDHQPIVRDVEDHMTFLNWLREASRQFKVGLHAYVLMPDHFHLLVTPADDAGLGRMMQWIGRHYVPYFNRKYGRTGTLWQARYKATVVDAAQYFMTCSLYIELKPLLAGLVAHAQDYVWSSYAHHIGARFDALITDHALYWALANTPFGREAAYKERAQQGLTTEDILLLTEATLKGWALGTEQFKTGIAKTANRRVSPGKRGRPVRRIGNVADQQ